MGCGCCCKSCRFWKLPLCSVDTFVIFFCRILISCTTSVGKKPDRFVPRTNPSSNPQSVEPNTSITSPVWMARWPMVELEYGSMQTTVVLGCPMEQTALSEFVPTPDESLIISLVSPMLLSILPFRQTRELREIPFRKETKTEKSTRKQKKLVLNYKHRKLSPTWWLEMLYQIRNG